MSQGALNRAESAGWNVPATAEEVRRSNEVRFAEFLSFASLAFPLRGVGGFPLSELMIGLAILIAAIRTPHYRALPVVTTLGLVLMGTYLISAGLNDEWDLRRLIHIAGFFALVHMLATGRLHLRSAASGLAFGLIVSITISVAELGGGAFSDRLRGEFADPNGGSFYMLALACVALSILESRRVRQILIVVVTAGVILTLSRTGIMSLAFTILWILNARILGWFTKILFAAGMYYFIGNVPTALKLWGPFKDRDGSDQLRLRIEAASEHSVATAGYFGHGPGTSTVDVNGIPFFFHSSYLALRNEVGIVGLVVGVSILLWIGFSLARLPRSLHNPWLEAALLAPLLVGVNVGEILVEMPTAVVLGAAMQHLSRSLNWEIDHGRPATPTSHRRE